MCWHMMGEWTNAEEEVERTPRVVARRKRGAAG